MSKSEMEPVTFERLIEILDTLEAGKSVSFAARKEPEDAVLLAVGVSKTDPNLCLLACVRRGKYSKSALVRWQGAEDDGLAAFDSRGKFLYRRLKRMARHSGLRIDRFSNYEVDRESLELLQLSPRSEVPGQEGA